ncbi:GNAT family N-acetyltransferase [Cohnella sp. JJ-181]|uniref:GNAT family N-acetyltransferase n=1 Tax=Cohnella rhizoplanae TaxID=2974897 RepID=UPI0022FF5408|nr:GNAT family N-acetyltransferase [Cohnella sp. JJ-181]CAI6081632.1 hypothetical protein COHCIP112018_03375 [Cohnella sp. JJ-181]
MERTRNVAVLIYEGVDTLDMAGPYDVFAVSSRWGRDLNVYTVAEYANAVTTVSGVSVRPRHAAADCPAPDILVVPGGLGARKEIHNEALVRWIRDTAETAELVLSVCTGALLLAKAGLLEGLRITTNRRAMDLLEEIAPASAEIARDVRYVDNGKFVLSGGVTTGMDAALHIVSRLFGEERARESASMLEYAWQPEGSQGENAGGEHAARHAGATTWQDNLIIRRATIEDVPELQKLYAEAAEWIRDRKGFRQWSPDAFTPAWIEAFMREQEVYAADLDGQLAGGFSINWHPEAFWEQRHREDAAYVHKLAVSREFGGRGIGSLLLREAERILARRDKSWLRLDCMADNPPLNAYYMRLGMRYCGRYDGQGWSASLYERQIRLER